MSDIKLTKKLARVYVTIDVMRDWLPWRQHPWKRLRLELGYIWRILANWLSDKWASWHMY